MTCATCRHAARLHPQYPGGMTLVCNASMGRADDPGLMAPTFNRRVPDDYFCAFHRPQPEPLAAIDHATPSE